MNRCILRKKKNFSGKGIKQNKLQKWIEKYKQRLHVIKQKNKSTYREHTSYGKVTKIKTSRGIGYNVNITILIQYKDTFDDVGNVLASGSRSLKEEN